MFGKTPSFLPSEASNMIRREGGGERWMSVVYLALHVLAALVLWIGISWTEFIWFLVLLQVRGFCLSAAYHRLLAHRSFSTSRLLQFGFTAVACTTLRGGPLWWVAWHRHHHRHSDTEEDIFSPAKGFWWTYCLWLVSGRFNRTDYSCVADLASHPELRWLNRFWLLPTLALAAGTILLAGWSGFIAIYCLSTVALLHTMAWIDALNHSLGRSRYHTGDQSRNNFVLSLLCNGEGWHNNHHHYPSSAKFGFFWWEVDGCYTVLRLLTCVGLVWNLKTPRESIVYRNLRTPNESAHMVID